MTESCGSFSENQMSARVSERSFNPYAYVLMDNHDHPLMERPGGNLIAGMKWLHPRSCWIRSGDCRKTARPIR